MCMTQHNGVLHKSMFFRNNPALVTCVIIFLSIGCILVNSWNVENLEIFKDEVTLSKSMCEDE